jgi:serine protease Do
MPFSKSLDESTFWCRFFVVIRALLLRLGLMLAFVPIVQAESQISMEELAGLEQRVMAVSKKAAPATVALVSEETGSSGSGILVSKDGLILTAAHVIQGMDEVDVYFANGKQWRAKVLGANFSKDIGMVKMMSAGPWPFVEIGESKPLDAGDWVVAMGHSAGFDPARTPPLRFGRVMSDGPGNYFTTDCTLIGGDSGGPLFDLDAKLVGINSSIGVSWENNNHAGVDGFREDWNRLMAGETWGTLQMNPLANPETPVLGIEMGLRRVAGGVPVQKVVANSPAAVAGLRPGDVIFSINNEQVKEGADLQKILVKKEAGDSVSMGIDRNGEKLEISVKLVKREELYQSR